MIIFSLTDEQEAKYLDWCNHCNTNAGAIGGKITFEFTPTGVGVIITAKCICGEKLDLTNDEDW